MLFPGNNQRTMPPCLPEGLTQVTQKVVGMKEGKVQTGRTKSPSRGQESTLPAGLSEHVFPKPVGQRQMLWGTQPRLGRELLPQLAAATRSPHHRARVRA